MFGFQTLSCLHDIPVVRSSTDKIQDVYAKAKNTNVLIRLSCNLAETIADKSLKIALTFVNPFMTPLRGPVNAIDKYAAQKIRQFESKYPVINTRPADVLNTFNEKTEPVRHVMNSVKDTTASTIQHGKDTVSNVATATVNKASGVADSVFSFYRNNGQRTQSNGYVFSTIASLIHFVFENIQTSLIWFRMLIVFFLLKAKQTNDLIIRQIQRKRFLNALPQRLLIVIGAFLEYFIAMIRPDDRTLAELKKAKQQYRVNQQTQNYNNRQSYKSNQPINTRQSVVVTKQETYVTRTNNFNQQSPPQPNYSNLTDTEELHAHLANNDYRQSMSNADDHIYNNETVDNFSNGDISQLHAHINPTDVELLYSRLPKDVLSTVDNEEPLNPDQQQLHARIIAAELERQGYSVDDQRE